MEVEYKSRVVEGLGGVKIVEVWQGGSITSSKILLPGQHSKPKDWLGCIDTPTP